MSLQAAMAKGNFGPQNQAFKRETRRCRDYLRNVCSRGKRCKFVHETTESSPGDLTFCHDFQNGKCNWPGCKFLHCTEDEEKHYRNMGELPLHIQQKFRLNSFGGDDKSEKPLCKDFFNGSCARVNCKFQHVRKEEVAQAVNFVVDHERQCLAEVNKTNEVIHQPIENHFNHTEYLVQPSAEVLGPPEAKRRMVSGEAVLHFETAPILEQHSSQSVTSNYFYPVFNRNEARFIVLEDENALLKKRISELQKQVNDLTATNEFLLDQNAQLRLSGKRTTSVTAVTVPAVTITNTGLPSQATTPQQMVNAAVAAGTLRTVTASVATVPVSIAAVTPVSIAAVSMTPVSIPPPIVTVAQQTITMSNSGPQAGNQQPPNSQQPASLPLSISGATAPLVSYPIMTQELRPVLQ